VNPNHLSLDKESRDVLGSLAGAMLPLNAWLQARGVSGYKPPNADKLPWRDPGGGPLSIHKLGVIEFIEALLRESAGDIFLHQRWQTLEADPLKFCPIDNTSEWRGARDLDADPRFGAVESENISADYSGDQISRSELYADYLPLLATAAKTRNPQGDAEWTKFMLELFNDECPQWPKSQSYRSSKFMLQLLRDLLYAVLGMRNPVEEPWRSAVLTEIGEFRRPGNKYSRIDIDRGLEEFKTVLNASLAMEGVITDKAYELADSVKTHYLGFINR
jgi:hypothetical protein